MADRENIVHRSGLLQHSEQPAAEPAGRTKLLVELCRALIRFNPSPDVLHLALFQAQDRSGATDDETEQLGLAVLQVQAGSGWPKGFF